MSNGHESELRTRSRRLSPLALRCMLVIESDLFFLFEEELDNYIGNRL